MTDENQRQELTGWKQIASHLGVSQPTARKYFKKDDLPVYSRGRRYYTFPEELDAWLRQQRAAPNEGQRLALRARWIASAVAITAGVVGVILVARSFSFPGSPDSVSVEGTVLTAWDKLDQVVWQKDVNRFLPSAKAKRPDLYLVQDIDEDSRNEVAITVRPANARAENSKLVCLDDDGEILWEFANGRELTVRGRYFEPYYNGKTPRWVETAVGSFILNVADHTTWYPTQVTLLDPGTGTPVLEYWHPGRVTTEELCDLDGDGEEELYLGGINNPGFGTGHPSLAVLRLPRHDQANPVRETFFRDANPQESDYVLFPLYDVFNVQEVGASVLLAKCQESGRLMLGIGQRLHDVVYIYLNANLEVEDIRPAEGFIQLHKELYVKGFLDHPYHPRELVGWRKVVKFPSLPDGNSPEVRNLFQ